MSKNDGGIFVKKYCFFIVSLLYLLFCLADQGRINGVVVFVLSLFFIYLLYHHFKYRFGVTKSLLFLMNLTLPISFRSITGTPFADLPLPWFYVLGFVFFVVTLNNLKHSKNSILSFSLALLIILSLVPLFISKNLEEGFKEMMTYVFFYLMLFAACNTSIVFSEKELSVFYDTFVFGCLFSALGIFYQYFYYINFGVEKFRVEYYGGGRVFLGFLFYDMSTVSLYMVTGALMMIVRNDGNRIVNYLKSIMIVVGAAASSARTGFVVYVIFVSLYIMFSKKRDVKSLFVSIFLILVLAGASLIAFSLMGQVRDASAGLSFLMDDNGRFNTYSDGVEMFLNNPFTGAGFDMPSQLSAMNKMVPHFALINILGQTGFIYTLVIMGVLVALYNRTRLLKDETLKWSILISYAGSCLVPGFFSARYFTMLGILALSDRCRMGQLNKM